MYHCRLRSLPWRELLLPYVHPLFTTSQPVLYNFFRLQWLGTNASVTLPTLPFAVSRLLSPSHHSKIPTSMTWWGLKSHLHPARPQPPLKVRAKDRRRIPLKVRVKDRHRLPLKAKVKDHCQPLLKVRVKDHRIPLKVRIKGRRIPFKDKGHHSPLKVKVKDHRPPLRVRVKDRRPYQPPLKVRVKDH